MTIPKLYFASIDGGQYDLWVTDGTAAGTMKIDVGNSGFAGLAPDHFAVLNGKVYLRGSDSAGRSSLFSIDGATNQEVEIVPIDSSSTNGFTPGGIVSFDGSLFLQGQAASGAYTLFKSDGTAAGTAELPVSGENTGFYPSSFTRFGDQLAFTGEGAHVLTNELFVTDGTTAGTTVVPLPSGPFGPAVRSVAAIGNTLVFAGASTTNQQGLFATDGTSAGTIQLGGAGLNPSGGYTGSPAGLTTFGTKVAFTAADSAGRNGIWVTDGTVAGTLELAGVMGNAYGVPMVALPGGRLAFIGFDKAGASQVWLTDGTFAGTYELRVAGASASGLAPHAVMALGNQLLFDGVTSTGDRGLFTSDGTAAGTSLLRTGVDLVDGDIGSDTGLLTDSVTIAASVSVSVAGGSTVVLGTATPGLATDLLSVALLTDRAFPTGSNVSIDGQGRVQYAPGTITASNVGTDNVQYRVTDLLTGQFADASASVALQIGQTAPPSNPVLGYANGTTGQNGTLVMDAAAAGGPSYLQSQYIYAGSDSIAFSTQAPNVFIHAGSGNDAIQVASGQNVLDGGLGSNFETGGTGMDTFFTDSRGPGVVWNTIRNFHAGDAATLWGFTAGISSYRWESAVAGAPGSEGATLRANIVGGAGRTGDGIDASITFTGLSVQQAQHLQIVTGTQAAGNYLYIYNQGV